MPANPLPLHDSLAICKVTPTQFSQRCQSNSRYLLIASKNRLWRYGYRCAWKPMSTNKSLQTEVYRKAVQRLKHSTKLDMDTCLLLICS